MHTHLPLGSTRHLLAYINTVLGMLGGTQTTYAGNCSRCGHWKPPTHSYGGTNCLPPEDGGIVLSEPMNRIGPLHVFILQVYQFPSTELMKGQSGCLSEHLLSVNFGFQKKVWYVLPVSSQLVIPVLLVSPNSDGEGVTLASCWTAQRPNRGRVSCHPRHFNRQNISRKKCAWRVLVLLEIIHLTSSDDKQVWHLNQMQPRNRVDQKKLGKRTKNSQVGKVWC